MCIEASGLRPLITTKEAEALGIGPARTIRMMCERKEIQATKIGQTWRIARDPLLAQFGLTASNASQDAEVC